MVTRSNSHGSHHYMPTPAAPNFRGGGLLRCLRFCKLRKMSSAIVQQPAGNNGLKDLSDKVAKAFCFKCRRTTCRVSSSSSSRSPFVVSPLDVHRKEAIKDCIDFINHSSSLPRSNSVSAA